MHIFPACLAFFLTAFSPLHPVAAADDRHGAFRAAPETERKAIKVGPWDQPGTPRSGAYECDGRLKNACGGADECYCYPTYTEYECECNDRDNPACQSDPDTKPSCIAGYDLERDDQGNGGGSVGGNGIFFTCNCNELDPKSKGCELVRGCTIPYED